MGTTPNGYPYPEDTDVVTAGARGIKTLASAVDTRVRASAAGSVVIPVNTSTTIFSKSITFPAGRFTATPAVVASVSMSWYVASISGLSATGCTITIRNVTTGTESGSRTAYWIATAVG